MVYYTKDSREVEFSPSEDNYIHSGTQGSVYRYSADKCIKVYYDNETSCFEEDMFETFKKFNLANYCKLYELLYDENNRVSSFIMEYCESIKENILFMPTEYTLENLSLLFKSVNTLSAEGIITRDMYYKNVILREKEITIIDFDKCARVLAPFMVKPTVEYSFKKEELRSTNINNLLCLFEDIYKESLKSLGIDVGSGSHARELLNYLFSYSYNPPKTLAKKLAGVKKPIDLLYKK